MNFQSINLHLQDSNLDTSHYWPFTWEYSIWNAAVTALQFWMADLKPHVLCNAKDQVYTTFFYVTLHNKCETYQKKHSSVVL